MGLIDSLKRLVTAGGPKVRADGGEIIADSPVERLYAAVVAQARQPGWYNQGQVPDTLDGRFDMVVLVLSFLLLRLEAVTDGNPRHPAARLSAELADRFLADMEGNLRQDGIGDQVVPRHLGQMMAALGGRLGAYRDARGESAAMADALRRNLLRGATVSDEALDWLVSETRAVSARLAATPFDQLAAGDLELAP
jgi:cytochrome b pre-mRNA-processing protein 3